MIFISYARADETAARRVAATLHAAGLITWTDWQSLDLSLPIEQQLRAAVAAASIIFVIASETVLQSEWVRFELEAARELKKPTLFVNPKTEWPRRMASVEGTEETSKIPESPQCPAAQAPVTIH